MLVDQSTATTSASSSATATAKYIFVQGTASYLLDGDEDPELRPFDGQILPKALELGYEPKDSAGSGNQGFLVCLIRI